MNRKKMAQLIIMICLCMIMMPAVTAKAANVKITYKGKTASYSRKCTYIYINNKKVSITKQPTFMKDACYMGSATAIFKNSSLSTSVKTSATRLIITYKDKKLIMQNGKKTAILNNKTVSLDTKVMKATYKASKKTAWMIPLRSVCELLDLAYETSNPEVKIANKVGDTTTLVPAPTKALVLCLDAGHGGSAPGASGKRYLEKNFNLEIVNQAAQYFDDDHRFKVYYTRRNDTNPSLLDRTALANNKNADLFISIHINSASNLKASGTETLYNPVRLQATKKRGIDSKMLAMAMQNGAVAATGFYNRGLKERTDLSVLNHANMPACLIEYGFISNAKDEITMHANLAKYGKALYDTIVSFSEAANLLPK